MKRNIDSWKQDESNLTIDKTTEDTMNSTKFNIGNTVKCITHGCKTIIKNSLYTVKAINNLHSIEIVEVPGVDYLNSYFELVSRAADDNRQKTCSPEAQPKEHNMLKSMLNVALSHGKWTGKSALNLLINVAIIMVCFVAYNTATNQEDGTRFYLPQNQMIFESYDPEAQKIVIKDNDQKQIFVNTGDGFANISDFTKTDSSTTEFLNRCVQFYEFHKGNTENRIMPTNTVSSWMPSFDLGNW